MECNKDEAVRAKELAEKKFLEKNYASAKKFLVKAQTLYPELDGLAQMLTIYDVYVSAETKINGEADWYRILSVSPFADDETIKKQYRRLAFLLHPDKNKSVGAEGAFKLVSEAWRLLSDKDKRLAYNQKRNLKGSQQEVPSRTGVPSAKPSANIYQNVMNSATSNARAQPGPNIKVSQQEVSSSTGVPSAKRRENTFKDVMNGATSNARAQPGPNLKGSQQEVSSRIGVPSKKPRANSLQNVMSGATSNARAQPGLAPPSHGKAAAFWTVCNECSTYYQYLKIYQNKALICPNCQKPFVATEKVAPADIFKSSSSSSFQPPKNSSHHAADAGNSFSSGRNSAVAAENLSPADIFNSSSSSSFQQHKNSRHHAAGTGNSFSFGRNSAVAQNLGTGGSLGPNLFNNSNLKPGSFSKMTSLGSTVASGHAGGGLVHLASDKGKRDVLRRQSIAEWEKSRNLMGNSLLRKRSMDNSYLNDYEGYMANRKSMRNVAADLGGVSELSTGNAGTKRIYGVSGKYNRPNVARELPYPQMRKMLIDKARSAICKVLEEQSSTTADTTRNSDSDVAEEAKPPRTINVPDPDFHNFDLDRIESCFKEEQVWAAYDNDGMPRFYARIHKVISLKPFKMQISWLNSRSNTELGPLNWVGSGFAKTCGDFRPGRHEIADTLNAFSNQVNWTKISRGVIRIFPRKGEVWALYRNWSPDWNEDTPDSVIEKYDMVEVLDDFTEEHGVSVVPLSKVAGFRTVFRKNMDPIQVRRIPKEEMFRLSHQVPSHLLTGEEAQNAPKGCWELDPAAMPSELLEVITEGDGGKTKEENFQSASTTEAEGGMQKGVVNKPTMTGNGADQ